MAIPYTETGPQCKAVYCDYTSKGTVTEVVSADELTTMLILAYSWTGSASRLVWSLRLFTTTLEKKNIQANTLFIQGYRDSDLHFSQEQKRTKNTDTHTKTTKLMCQFR